MGLKTILADVGTKLLTGSLIQKFASVTIALGIAGQLYDKFQQMIDNTHQSFNQLSNLDFSNYLVAYMDLAGLPEAITIIVSTIAFAITWRITYDLKPKSKV